MGPAAATLAWKLVFNLRIGCIALADPKGPLDLYFAHADKEKKNPFSKCNQVTRVEGGRGEERTVDEEEVDSSKLRRSGEGQHEVRLRDKSTATVLRTTS